MHIRTLRGVVFRRRWDQLRGSYWFVPLVTAVVALLFSRVMLWLDSLTPDTRPEFAQLIFTASKEEARTVLLALAGTILATAGIVFTMLTVPLSLAASQFGSRLLRVYQRNSITQLVLGLFVGTFVYCLIAALSIPGADTANPRWTATVGLLLALIAVGSLLVLIQSIATSLQAPNMVAAAGDELHDTVRRRLALAEQSVSADAGKHAALLARIEQEGVRILGRGRGYIQAIDPAVLLPLAGQHDLVIYLVRKPGSFIQQDELVALAWPPQRVRGHVADAVRRSVELGNLRTPTQDIVYAVNQLVEVAVRAMSAAINDPFTAVTCLDHLGAGLALYAEQHARAERLTCWYDEREQLRLVVDVVTFAELLDAAFNLIRRAAREYADVLLAMVAALEVINHKCQDPAYRAELRRHLQLIADECAAGSMIAWDKERVLRRCAELLERLDQSPRLVQSS